MISNSLNDTISKINPLRGNIYGFLPGIDRFQGGRGKLDEVWSSVISEFYLINDEIIMFKFSWERTNYVVNMKRINDTNFQGRIIADGELAGTAYYSVYYNQKGFLLRGTWNEENLNYDSFIEIRK